MIPSGEGTHNFSVRLILIILFFVLGTSEYACNSYGDYPYTCNCQDEPQAETQFTVTVNNTQIGMGMYKFMNSQGWDVCPCLAYQEKPCVCLSKKACGLHVYRKFCDSRICVVMTSGDTICIFV